MISPGKAGGKFLIMERLLKCEPIDLGRSVVDLWERHLDDWTPLILKYIHGSATASAPLNQWCALPTKRALVTHSPYTLPRNMLFDLPCDVISSVARFRLRARTLQIETVTWTHKLPYL